MPPYEEDVDLFTDLMAYEIENGAHLAGSFSKISFGSGLVVRLYNSDTEPHNSLGAYMEGCLRHTW